MSTIIKTIKSKLTDDTIYPITKAGAVYLNDNVTTVESIIGNTSITGIGNGTITDAISTLNNDLYNNYFQDTGWVDLVPFLNTTNWTVRSNFGPAVRLIGNRLYFRGQIYLTTTYTTPQVVVFSGLASIYRPQMQITGTGATTTGATYTLWINLSGNIQCTLSDKTVQTSTQGIDLSELNGGIVD